MIRSMVATLLLHGLMASAGAEERAQPVWELSGGRTELVLNRHQLEDLGITALDGRAAGTDGGFEVSSFALDRDFPTLRLSEPGGALEGHVHGALRHRGMLELSWPGGKLSLSDFEIVPAAGEAQRAGKQVFLLKPLGQKIAHQKTDRPANRHPIEKTECLGDVGPSTLGLEVE